ncbi:MAG: hypothetical protein JWP81_2281 [Ferruginibacter sp.]|nr:hypothetical protein [Ferruginibacter sp.]
MLKQDVEPLQKECSVYNDSDDTIANIDWGGY